MSIEVVYSVSNHTISETLSDLQRLFQHPDKHSRATISKSVAYMSNKPLKSEVCLMEGLYCHSPAEVLLEDTYVRNA